MKTRTNPSNFFVTNNNTMNNSQFKEKLAKFVITGRYFAIPIQYAQVMNIICSRSHSMPLWESVNKQKLYTYVAKRHKTLSRTCFNCPFCIRYSSLPGFTRQSSDPAWKSRIIYKVNSLHCTLCLSTNQINLTICDNSFFYNAPFSR